MLCLKYPALEPKENQSFYRLTFIPYWTSHLSWRCFRGIVKFFFVISCSIDQSCWKLSFADHQSIRLRYKKLTTSLTQYIYIYIGKAIKTCKVRPKRMQERIRREGGRGTIVRVMREVNWIHLGDRLHFTVHKVLKLPTAMLVFTV